MPSSASAPINGPGWRLGVSNWATWRASAPRWPMCGAGLAAIRAVSGHRSRSPNHRRARERLGGVVERLRFLAQQLEAAPRSGRGLGWTLAVEAKQAPGSALGAAQGRRLRECGCAMAAPPLPPQAAGASVSSVASCPEPQLLRQRTPSGGGGGAVLGDQAACCEFGTFGTCITCAITVASLLCSAITSDCV